MAGLRLLVSLSLSPQPQAGVPDVLLWLLQGDRRVACARVPVPDIMFSPSGPGACGRFCGRIQTLFLVVGTPCPLPVTSLSPPCPFHIPFTSPQYLLHIPSMSPFVSPHIPSMSTLYVRVPSMSPL